MEVRHEKRAPRKPQLVFTFTKCCASFAKLFCCFFVDPEIDVERILEGAEVKKRMEGEYSMTYP
jgi:hypothetical protein